MYHFQFGLNYNNTSHVLLILYDFWNINSFSQAHHVVRDKLNKDENTFKKCISNKMNGTSIWNRMSLHRGIYLARNETYAVEKATWAS